MNESEVLEKMQKICACCSTSGSPNYQRSRAEDRADSGEKDACENQMLKDMIYMNALLHSLFTTILYIATGQISAFSAVSQASAAAETSDEIVEKWQMDSRV